MKTRLSPLMAVGRLVVLPLTFWLLLAAVATSAGPAPAQLTEGTIVGGTIETDTTWTLAGSPYTLETQNVTVIDNVTLTIEAGVTIELNAARNLWVAGTLLAVGTPTQPITFTRMAGVTQPWGALQIGGGSVLTDSNASQVSYATVEGGGSGGQMLYVYNSAPTLDHLTLRNSSGKGLFVSNVSTSSTVSWDTGTVTGSSGEGVYVATGRLALSNLDIADNGAEGVEFGSAHDSQLLNSSIQGNGGNGIHSSGSNRLLLEGLTVTGNAGYGIHMQSYGVGSVVRDTTVQGNAVAARLNPDVSLENVTWTGNTRSEIEWIGGRIYSSRTWARLPEITTYRVLADITAMDGTTLNVAPGVTVQLQEYVSLYANGGLWAVGTPSQPITFTRIAGAAHPWGMVQIGGGTVNGDSDASRVSYATFEDGGFEGKLVHIYYSSASMDQVTVRNSSSIGIQVSPIAGTQVTLDTVAVTNNAGVAIYHHQPGSSLSYRHLTLQGNGTDAVSIGSGTIDSPVQWDLADAGAPVRSGTLHMYGGGFLALMPGSRLEFAAGAQVEVWFDSALYALGTPESPITLTGTLTQPGAWKGVWLHPSSRAILRNCNLEYGGAAGEPALKMQSPRSAVMANSAIRYAAGDGVLVDTATPPVLRHNDISGNAFGVRNNRSNVTVDARHVWWGDASGPYHPSLNPGGLGNAVSDGVLFEPWLTSVPTGTVPLGGLIVQAGGPQGVSPGQSAVFGAAYLNETGQEIRDAVLVLLLPSGADFEEAYPASTGEGRGIYWAERNQVFWRLGTLPPGAAGTVAARVRFYWGLPAHTDSVMVMMAGSNQGAAGLDLASTGLDLASTGFSLPSYLAHVPVDILSTTALTPAEVDAEQGAYPVLNSFFLQGLAQGFAYTSATRAALSTGTSMVDITLNRPDGTGTMDIVRIGQVVQAYVVTGNSSALRTTVGDMIYDRATDTTYFTGQLAGGAGSTSSEPVGLRLHFVGIQSGGLQGYPTYGECLQNCLQEAAKNMVVRGFMRRAMGRPPLEPDDVTDVVDIAMCESECEDDPTSHYCIEDNVHCFGNEVLGGLAIADHRIMRQVCDKDTGLYEPVEEFVRQCPWSFPPMKCVYGPDDQPTCASCGKGTGRDCNEVDVRVSKDPNAKYGLAGDLLPGDIVSYTVTYENVGEGIAYGVYVEDRLSEHLDENTLVIGQGGQYLGVSRTILWEIGELGPEGSPTASGAVTFTAQLRAGLPGGTAIINQAVVYFPSAPEETPTNQVVNVIWPIVGVPTSVTLQAGHSVPITLAGRDTGQGPLTFEVVNPPARGTLAGTPPALTYAAPSGFAGQDLFTFKVSNAITDSRPAEVTVLVLPDPFDATPPTVTWTGPEDGAVVGPISASPAFTDTIGPLYTPYVFVGFGEAIDAGTVTTATLLVTQQDGTAIPVTVSYNSLTAEAIALLRQPLEPGTTYTVRATQGIKDLAGNPLAEDFMWTFRTAGGDGRNVYLPLVVRGH